VPPRAGGLRGALGIHPALVSIGIGALFVPRVLTSYWVFNVCVGLVLAIACLGLVAVVGWAREISLMQAGLTGSALYLTGYRISGRLGTGEPVPLPVAALYGVGFAVVVSVLVALVSMRLAGAYLAVLTLSVQFLLENTVLVDSRMGMWDGTYPRPHFFATTLNSDARFYFLVLGVLFVSMVFLHRFRHSRFGRAMVMAGADRQAAATVGISPWAYRVWAFAIAGLFAGVAGALSSPLYYSPPGTLQYISFNSLFYVAIPVLAGCESLMTVAGLAILFTLLPQVFLDAGLNVYLLGGVGLAVGVLLGPRGLGGALADLFERARRG
jgi:ABC-type branched-subunit amino acid transport system permease subunit